MCWISLWRFWGKNTLEQSEFERLFRLVLTQYSVGTIPVALDQVSVSEITRNDRHTSKLPLSAGSQRPRAARTPVRAAAC